MKVIVDIIALDCLSRSGVSAAHMVEHHQEHMTRVVAGTCGCELGKSGATAMQCPDGVVLIISELEPGSEQFYISGHRREGVEAGLHRPHAPHPN